MLSPRGDGGGLPRLGDLRNGRDNTPFLFFLLFLSFLSRSLCATTNLTGS